MKKHKKGEKVKVIKDKSASEPKKPMGFNKSFIINTVAASAVYTVALIAVLCACVLAGRYLSWYADDPFYKLIRAAYREPVQGVGFIIIMWLIGIAVILGVMLKRALSYINAVVDASQKLMREDGAPIELPRPLSDVEEKMNAVKEQSIYNYRLAKEQEQKKNDLLVYLAHDLKTPLTSVIGYLTLVDDAPGLPEENKTKYMRIALEKAERLELLLNEFFDITRFSLHGIELERKRINLNILLYQMAEEFYPVYKERGLDIKVDTDEPVVIAGDPDKIARVFDNLLKNAANYSHKDTTVEISARLVDGNAVVKVKNRADEIPKESLDKLFDMFYRADASRNASSGGAGVGLAVSKEIVELHGGTIGVMSNKEFTEFTVTLPTGR